MTSTPLPWYTDPEIDDLCQGLTNNAAKVRHLRSMGLTVARKPNGRPLVMRSHASLVLSGLPPALAATENIATTPSAAMRQPNRAALVLQFGSRGA